MLIDILLHSGLICPNLASEWKKKAYREGGGHHGLGHNTVGIPFEGTGVFILENDSGG